jgi:S1-C subfamily serine protease
MARKLLLLLLIFLVLGCFQISDFNKLSSNILGSCVTVYGMNGYGSGVYIRSNLVLTAGHCTEQFLTGLSTKEKENIKILKSWRSASFDVGFLEVDTKRTPVPLGDMPKLLDTTYLVGTPYCKELNNTITKGIVSSVYRDISYFIGLIQTDAEGAPGSSGSPLLNANFEIIGICVSGPNPGGGVTLCEPVSHIRLALKEYDASH